MGRKDTARAAALAAGLEIEDDVVVGRHGDIPVRRYRARSDDPIALVWAHGGAFSHGGLDQLESHAVAAALARRGHGVIAVDYRRVPPWSWFRDPAPGTLPGTRFPLPLDDVEDVFRTVRETYPDAALGGASAGACLSAAAALRLARAGAEPPRRLVLAYGTFHAELPPASAQLRLRVRGRHGLFQFTPQVVRRMNHNYAGSASAMNHAFAFPGGHDLHGMPPTLLIDADRDVLRASAEDFVAGLSSAGVETRHVVVPDTRHGFLDAPASAGFDEGIAHIASWLT